VETFWHFSLALLVKFRVLGCDTLVIESSFMVSRWCECFRCLSSSQRVKQHIKRLFDILHTHKPKHNTLLQIQVRREIDFLLTFCSHLGLKLVYQRGRQWWLNLRCGEMACAAICVYFICQCLCVSSRKLNSDGAKLDLCACTHCRLVEQIYFIMRAGELHIEAKRSWLAYFVRV